MCVSLKGAAQSGELRAVSSQEKGGKSHGRHTFHKFLENREQKHEIIDDEIIM